MTTSKRSGYELKRLIEDAVRTECGLDDSRLQFIVDEVEASGRPPDRLRVWATLHFLPAGSPFCCGEPGCHLGLSGERLEEVADHIRRAMGIEQTIVIDFGKRIAVRYHDGVEFRS